MIMSFYNDPELYLSSTGSFGVCTVTRLLHFVQVCLVLTSQLG